MAAAPRAQADLVLAIRYAHARPGRASRSGHDHGVAFMMVGTCPTKTANYFSSRAELIALVERFARGELLSDEKTTVPHEVH